MQLTEQHHEYWRKNVRLTAILLAIWFVVTYVVAWFARDLNAITVFGFPLGLFSPRRGGGFGRRHGIAALALGGQGLVVE